MRRAVILAGVGAVVGAIVVYQCAGSRPDSADDSTGSKASRTLSNSRTRIDPKTLAKASISGKVITESAAPISGARVCAREYREKWTRELFCANADASGAYTIGNLVPTSYVVTASARSFHPASHGKRGHKELALAPGEHKPGADITLHPGGVELVGTVVDLTGGPIANARVSAEGGMHEITSVECDGLGRFVLWVAAGTTYVTAQATGYAESMETVMAPGTAEIALTPASSLSGLVVDASRNEAVVGVELFANALDYDGRGTTTSDDSGRFRFEGLTPGRYDVKGRTANGFGSNAGSILIGLGQDIDGVVLKLWPAHQIEARLVVSTTKEPCPRGWITLNEPTHGRYAWGEPRADGGVVIDGLLPGTYRVDPHCEGFRSRDTYPPITVETSDVRGVVWEVDPGAGIRGRVVTSDGTPLTGRRVSATSEPYMKNGLGFSGTDANGGFEIAGLAPGKYRIHARSAEESLSGDYWRRHTGGLEVELAGSTIERDIIVEETATLVGVVVDASGKPQSGMVISAFSEKHFEDGKSDVAGRFSLLVAPGEQRVAAHRKGAPNADVMKRATRVTAIANQSVGVRLVVTYEAAAIDGVVLDSDGKPVSDAYVYASHATDDRTQRRSWNRDDPLQLTSSDGTFRIDGLAPGAYSVHAYRKGGGEAVTTNVATGTRTTLRIRRTATIEGVARHGGKPIGDLAIELNYSRTWDTRREQFFRTDGRFTIRDLPDGKVNLVAIADGMRSTLELELVAGQTKAITIDVAAPVTLTGRVVELGTKTPVAGLTMNAKLAIGFGAGMLDKDDPTSVTDTTGRFTFSGVPVGKIAITGHRQDHGMNASVWTVRDVVGTGTVDVGDISLVRERVKDREWPGEIGFELEHNSSWAAVTNRPLKIKSIDGDGPAAKSGLQVGDLITSIDGHDARGENSYVSGLLRAPAGTKVTIGVERGVTVSITLAPRKPPPGE